MWQWPLGLLSWYQRKTTWHSPAWYLRGRGAAVSSSFAGSSLLLLFPLTSHLPPLHPPRLLHLSLLSFLLRRWASRKWSCMGTTPVVFPSQSFVCMRNQRQRCTGCGFSMWQGQTRVSTPVEFRRFANTETHGEHLPMVPAPHSWQVGLTKAVLQHTLLSMSHLSVERPRVSFWLIMGWNLR